MSAKRCAGCGGDAVRGIGDPGFPVRYRLCRSCLEALAQHRDLPGVPVRSYTDRSYALAALRLERLADLRRASTPETEIARPVVEHLRHAGWHVYQEIEIHQGGPRADIVGLRGAEVLVVEAKKSLTFDVVAQALRWAPYAHAIAVAVPATGEASEGRRFAGEVLRWKEVGLFEVNVRLSPRFAGGAWDFTESIEVKERGVVASPERGQGAADVRRALTPAHENFAAAGNADGLRLTKFKATCIKVAAEVRARPGMTIAELVDAVQTHYANRSSAISGLRHWITEGKVPGVRMDATATPARLYPTDN